MAKQPKTLFKRSRGGCKTCRTRKKKCDEQFDDRGHCQRCLSSGFACEPLEPGTSLPKQPKSSGTRSPTSASSSSSSPRPRPPPNPPAATSLPSFQQSQSQHNHRPPSQWFTSPSAPSRSLTAPTPGSYSALFAGHPTPRPPPFPPLPATTAPEPTWSSQLETPFDPLADIGYSSELLSFFESLNPAIDGATQDLFDPGNLFNDDLPQPGPSAESLTPKHSASAGDSDLPRLAAVVAAAAGEAGSRSATPAPPLAAVAAAAGGFNVSSVAAPRPVPPSAATLSDSGDAHHDDAVQEIRPVYDQLNENFFASLPLPVREVVKRRMAEVAFSTELSKSACMAVCLLYRARMLEKVAPDARERLINRSNSYFLKAVEHLQGEAGVPLEAQVLAVFDLQLFQLEQYGAAAGNAILLLGDYFVTEALGPRPTLDLQSLSGPASVMYRSFAYTDVLRCFALGDRRTLFALAGVPGEVQGVGAGANSLPGSGAASAAQSPVGETALEGGTESSSNKEGSGGAVWARDREHNPWGLPPALLLAIAGIVNLAQDVKQGLVFSDEYNRRRDTLETAIRSWRPSADSPWPGSMPHGVEEAADDSVRTMEHMTTAEMWRHAALIYLYQALDHHGPLHPLIRRSVAQLLALGSRDATQATATAVGFDTGATTAEKYKHVFNITHNERAMQWFVCGTCVISPQEREFCRAGMRQTRPTVLAQGNLEALERVWQLTDERGWTVDWRETLANEGRHIAFA